MQQTTNRPGPSQVGICSSISPVQIVSTDTGPTLNHWCSYAVYQKVFLFDFQFVLVNSLLFINLIVLQWYGWSGSKEFLTRSVFMNMNTDTFLLFQSNELKQGVRHGIHKVPRPPCYLLVVSFRGKVIGQTSLKCFWVTANYRDVHCWF